jgi:hypothetical protein
MHVQQNTKFFIYTLEITAVLVALTYKTGIRRECRSLRVRSINYEHGLSKINLLTH